MKKHICRLCGKSFKPTGRNSKYCDACRKTGYTQSRKTNRAQKKVEKKVVAKVQQGKTDVQRMNAFLRELEAYNAKHKKHLSYGKYESMKHMERQMAMEQKCAGKPDKESGV